MLKIFSYMQEILAIGFFQGLILSSLLFLKSRQNKNFTWLMGLFVLLISAFIAGPLLNQWIGEPWGSFLVDPLFLLIGPSFYGYILLLSRPEKEKSLKFHTIPFFLYLPLLAFFASKVYKTQADPQSLKIIYSSGFAVGLGIIKFAHLLIYVGLSFWELRNHQDRIQKIFSNLKGKDLLWVKYILISFLALSLISLGFYLFALQNPNWQNEITFFNLVLLSVFFNLPNFLFFSSEEHFRL